MAIDVRVFPLKQRWLPELERARFFRNQFVPADEPEREPGRWRCGTPIISPPGSRVLFQNHDGFIIGDAVVGAMPAPDPPENFFLRFEPCSIRWLEPARSEPEVQSIWANGWRQRGRGLHETRGELRPLVLHANRNRWYLDADRLPEWNALVRDLNAV